VILAQEALGNEETCCPYDKEIQLFNMGNMDLREAIDRLHYKQCRMQSKQGQVEHEKMGKQCNIITIQDLSISCKGENYDYGVVDSDKRGNKSGKS